MAVETGRSPAGMVEGTTDLSREERLGEERARQILERAAALDAKRSSEIEIGQLEDAAAQAGISAEAFEQALREDAESSQDRLHGPYAEARPTSEMTAPGSEQVSHYAGLLRDLLGDDAKVVVVEDRIEARDSDGVTVSINPSSGDTTAAILSEGRLRSRLLAIILPIVIPVVFALVLGMEEEDVAAGVAVGAVLAVVGSAVATVISDLRERKALRKKAERLRRQLQRLLAPAPGRD